MLALLCLLAASAIDTAVAEILEAAKLFAQGAPTREDLGASSKFWRTRVVDGAAPAVKAVRFYTPVSLPMRLRHLRALGPWKLGHHSKTSSVVFTHCVGAKRCASIYVQLLHPPENPESPVTSIRVSALSE